MTIRYWNNSKDGQPPLMRLRRIDNTFRGALMVLYITARYDHCDIESLGELA